MTGYEFVGGIAGLNAGRVEASSNRGMVTGGTQGSSRLSGIAGMNYVGAQIYASDNWGDVSGSSGVGGIAGNVLFLGTIKDTYSTGTVTGDTSHGGIAGSALFGSNVKSSYFDKLKAKDNGLAGANAFLPPTRHCSSPIINQWNHC